MCIFCQIVKSELPATKVYEDEQILAFRDISPVAPTHIVIIPKKHIASLDHTQLEDVNLLGSLQLKAAEIAKAEGLKNGYRLVNNCGVEGGQTVDHLHYHLIGGKALGWPPYN